MQILAFERILSQIGKVIGFLLAVIALLSTAHHDKSSSAPSLVFSRVVDLQDVDTKVVPLYLYRKDPDQHFQFQVMFLFFKVIQTDMKRFKSHFVLTLRLV